MTAPSMPRFGTEQPAFALFAYGFRPFFWAAGAYALVALAAWLWIYMTGRLPLPYLPPQLWHGHEMLYGFVVAAITGFLLTAVPSWTGTRGFAGTPLIVLAAIWVAGRLSFATAAWLPVPLVAAFELAFLPALVALIGPSLLREQNRNTPLLFVLAGIWLTDVTFLFAIMRADAALARTAVAVAIDIIMVLVTVIGGRIVPAFTASALRTRGLTPDLRSSRWVDRLAVGAMIAIVVVDVIAPLHPIAGAVAALAVLAQVRRFTGWRTLRTLWEPLVWCLHLAYVWLPIGLAMKAVFLLTGAVWSAHWMHALTIGVAASMVLSVMTRAALGHTGRALAASRTIAAAYVLVSLAAAVRVFAPAVPSIAYRWTVMTAGALWIAAFALFLIKYTPILMRPRIDGRPG